MRALLDTHIWLWSLLQPERLHRAVKKALTSAGAELWLSPISTWEFFLLVEKGRIALQCDPEEWLARAWTLAPCREAPLTHEIARETRRVDLAHGDPADRFLVATARIHGLTLVTADQRLIHVEGIKVLANR